jgi:hypothetical protein
MAGQPPQSEFTTRTGDFYFQVWQRSQKPWDWRLRVQVVETGEWGECDSLQEAVWIMRQHLRDEADVEAATLPEESDLRDEEDGLAELSSPLSISSS